MKRQAVTFKLTRKRVPLTRRRVPLTVGVDHRWPGLPKGSGGAFSEGVFKKGLNMLWPECDTRDLSVTGTPD